MIFGTSCAPRYWSGVVVPLPFEELSSSFDSPLSKYSTSSVLSVTSGKHLTTETTSRIQGHTVLQPPKAGVPV